MINHFGFEVQYHQYCAILCQTHLKPKHPGSMIHVSQIGIFEIGSSTTLAVFVGGIFARQRHGQLLFELCSHLLWHRWKLMAF